MKKDNKFLFIAILWIAIAFYFFSINKVGVGIPWLLIGVINLGHFLRKHKMNKQAQEVYKHLEETVNRESFQKSDREHKTITTVIEPTNEVHTICDEYIGYEYDVDKAFKPAKSHAGEVELLCTYAPDEEYGEEGATPYIAVQEDDKVYCAVEEYKDSKTFEGAISIEPQDGLFLFRAKREYYGDIMYFYGFELGEGDYWDMAGLCLVYAKEYVGTESEEKLLHILDEAAKSFKKRDMSV
ncbi:MAG: hypothetical protein J6L65_02135 [Lachnospiraceae bacterium]|nr:hypothetical protein [Lachnospiraceae bacterium]